MQYQNMEEMGQNLRPQSMENTFFLIGMLNEFMNRFQTIGDRFFQEISWKQCFVIICINLFSEPPTLKEVSEVMGCSHQNLKQMLLKLEKAGFVKLCTDDQDRRKQRIVMTEKTLKFNQEHEKPSAEFMRQLFANVDPKDLAITVNTIKQIDETLKTINIDAVKGVVQ